MVDFALGIIVEILTLRLQKFRQIAFLRSQWQIATDSPAAGNAQKIKNAAIQFLCHSAAF